MKKLDDVLEGALLGAFLQEKRRETGAVVKTQAPKAVVQASVPAPPPEDPRLVALRAENAAQHAALQRAEAELAMLRAQQVELKATHERLDRERRLADKRAAEAGDRVRALEAERAAADKTGLWRDRGLTAAEIPQALNLLAAAQPQAFFAAIMTLDPQPLSQLLNDRLALVCRAPVCQPAGDVLALHVPPERCELCGGSDLRAAYRTFAQATLAGKLPSVTFVGGSPAYRETLRLLHRELKPDFALDVIAKKRPGEGKRAQATRGLIVIWGGSEVDHDTTIHYRESGDRVLTMNHRGLSGLLPRLVAQLQKT